MKVQLKQLDKPIKETRICTECGRKKTFTYKWFTLFGGLWTDNNICCMPKMECPRCKKNTMVEVKEK